MIEPSPGFGEGGGSEQCIGFEIEGKSGQREVFGELTPPFRRRGVFISGRTERLVRKEFRVTGLGRHGWKVERVLSRLPFKTRRTK
ncbi:MAG: hypothetical protein L0Y38_04330 [Methylococcaceae bacterium]|nr:hypothetical protein [Methylococcaceae bacterium]MCI0733036.1 hypothetical protein [Methylococcaceae bacterium]